jgi:hypothetical protein
VFTRSERFYDAIYAWKDYASESVKLHRLIQRWRPGPDPAGCGLRYRKAPRVTCKSTMR